jgi:hypothetical protein
MPVNLAAALAVIAAVWDDGPRSEDNDFGMQFAVMAVRVVGWSVFISTLHAAKHAHHVLMQE